MKLEQIQNNAAISGLEPGQVVRIVATEPVGPDALTVYYKTADGKLLERMLFRTDEAKLSLAEVGRPWAFDAPGEDFKLAAEAYRIDLAHLFDPMMAVHTSNVEPLPHQITAVYESMLPRQPLRFVLADDPGAGKTIMAGLLIRELLVRADAKRVLIVAPGSLIEQWQDEMDEKFGLSFELYSREQVERTSSGNPFDRFDLLIARLDQLARAEDLQEKLRHTRWDLVVVDEAHKLSASYFGNKINKTKRFQLGELLGSITRHFLLMTATPHNGKEEDFQLFLSLLDADRFYGKFRDGAHRVDVSDLMRRMVKEDLLKFDDTPLFPERRAYTVNYQLSDLEAALYAAVTDYVKEQFNKADQLADGGRKGTVGFALTSLQRRLASSPEAIYQSLKRRRHKLKRRVEEEKLGQRGQPYVETLASANGIPEDIWESAEAMAPEVFENFEEALVDQASAAQTIQELEAEIITLEALEEQARQVVHSGQDRKWDELSRLLQSLGAQASQGAQASSLHPSGTPALPKLIVFTEHRDTLHYLADKIRGLLGSQEAVVSRREFLRELNATLPEALAEMTRGGVNSPVALVDLLQAIIGPGMAIFSQYAAVLEADGTPMRVRTALQLINRFLAEDDFDPDTQFCLHWFEQHGWAAGKFGEADVLARAKGTSVDGLREAGVVAAAKGEVRLLRWQELPEDWSPEGDARIPIWEALHHLIRALNQEGEAAAGALLARMPERAEPIRTLAYRLYTLCERQGWAEEARAYNELITAWSGIEQAAGEAGEVGSQTQLDI